MIALADDSSAVSSTPASAVNRPTRIKATMRTRSTGRPAVRLAVSLLPTARMKRP